MMVSQVSRTLKLILINREEVRGMGKTAQSERVV